MYNNEAESFAEFPAVEEWFYAADVTNFYETAYYDETKHFKTAFFAPGILRRTWR